MRQGTRLFISVGHDEYWSGPQRAAVEAARDAGTHLAFFSGNEVYCAFPLVAIHVSLLSPSTAVSVTRRWWCLMKARSTCMSIRSKLIIFSASGRVWGAGRVRFEADGWNSAVEHRTMDEPRTMVCYTTIHPRQFCLDQTEIGLLDGGVLLVVQSLVLGLWWVCVE